VTILRLPSFDAVTERLAEHLIYGQIVVLRGQPWSGRSSLLASVATQLEDLHVTRVTGSDNADTLRAAADDLETATSSGNSAAVLVDNFGQLLGCEHGIAFQNRLYALAVNGEQAPDAGVLLVARHNEPLTRFAVGGGGSPIAGAAQVNVNVPTLSRTELVEALIGDGCDEQSAERLVDALGAHLHLLSVARLSPNAKVPEAIQDEAVMRVVSETTGATAERLLELARHPERPLAGVLADELLAPAVYHPEEGRTRLCRILAARGIGSLLIGGRAGWPDNLNDSVRRFRCRLHGLADALWVDRYHGRHLDSLTQFFDRLANRECNVLLRMLGSAAGLDGLPAGPQGRFRASLKGWAQSGLRVEWRIATEQDYHLLHQRMLVSPIRLGGYLLPPGDRIIGAHQGGTDTDAILDHAPLALLANAWDRADHFA
jgi:hypothetical protein